LIFSSSFEAVGSVTDPRLSVLDPGVFVAWRSIFSAPRAIPLSSPPQHPGQVVAAPTRRP
jgi:hypothetical protein